MTTISASDPGKPVFQNPAIQITVNNLLDIGTKKTISTLKTIFINLFKGFEVVFHTQVIRRVLRLTRAVDGWCHGDIEKQIPCRWRFLDFSGRKASRCDGCMTISVNKPTKYVMADYCHQVWMEGNALRNLAGW